jgi:hypothetical protein
VPFGDVEPAEPKLKLAQSLETAGGVAAPWGSFLAECHSALQKPLGFLDLPARHQHGGELPQVERCADRLGSLALPDLERAAQDHLGSIEVAPFPCHRAQIAEHDSHVQAVGSLALLYGQGPPQVALGRRQIVAHASETAEVDEHLEGGFVPRA